MFQPARVHPLRPGLLLPGRLDPAGLVGPTRSQAQGRGVRRTTHGYYLPAAVTNDDVLQRIVEASVVVPPNGAITGWASLAWRRARWYDGTDGRGAQLPVTIVVGTRDIRPQAGLEVCAEGFHPRLRRWVDGVRVTDARDAVSYLMRRAPSDRHAIVELEKAAYDDLVSVEEMRDYLAGQNGWTGVPRARAALPWASENVWSPQEGWMLEIWGKDAGYRRPLANQPVFDLEGHHLGTPDLIDPESGVMGQYHGAVHLERTQNHLDLRAESRFRGFGLESVTMVAPDIPDPRHFIERLDTAYRIARGRPASARRWTIEQPSWWIDTTTVARRRALSPDQRRRLLRYRSA